MTDRTLRILEWGVQPPLRSQTLWHAVAYGVSDGAPTTLSFVRPATPYVSIGYHRRLDELDLDACRDAGLPVFRRMIGGGPVYLDRDQLFFQITVPAAELGLTGAHAMKRLLEPAVEAFRDVGIDAHLDDLGDISTPDGAKVSGVGGGQIEDAAIAVGNLLERFDHRRMTTVLALPDDVRDETLRLMTRYVTPTPTPDDGAFKKALVERYAAAFDRTPAAGELEPDEREALHELDARFVDPVWLRGPDRPTPDVHRVKIRAGVWVFDARADGARVVGSVVGDRLEAVRVHDPEANGAAEAIEDLLAGGRVEDAPDAARTFGAPGERVAEAIGRAMRRAL